MISHTMNRQAVAPLVSTAVEMTPMQYEMVHRFRDLNQDTRTIGVILGVEEWKVYRLLAEVREAEHRLR